MNGWRGMARWRAGERPRRAAGAVGTLLLLGMAVAGAPAGAGEVDPCAAEPQECVRELGERLKASGWVGVELRIDEKNGTHTIEKVIPGSPAESAGIRPGDLLVAINGVPVSTCRDRTLAETRRSWKPGMSVTYLLERNGIDREITATLGTMPADLLAKYLAEYRASLEKGRGK